jgi:GSH-dependent disulfide-bond oxidoreductase
MMELHTWHTPNGRKPAIVLAELGWQCRLHLVDLGKGEQKAPAYLAKNPNGKIPALVDGDVVVFESGAILQYLAEAAGRFLPRDVRQRAEVLSWTYWQIGGPGPMFGQLGAFMRETPRDEHAVSKFRDESRRLVGVLDGRLRGREWIAQEYSIADMASYPWFAAIGDAHPEILDGADAVREWMKRMAARPAVARGMALDVGAPRVSPAGARAAART